MTDFVYDNFIFRAFTSGVAMQGGAVKVMLTSDGYLPNKADHVTRSQINGEIGVGAGYTPGGKSVTSLVALDGNAHEVSVTLGGVTWTVPANETLNARRAVYYLDRGSAANDVLIACVDFDATQSAGGSAAAENFTLSAYTLRFRNDG